MADNSPIRTFHFEASQADLADLRRRVSATKWPEQEQVPDATQGVQLATAQKLAQYWATQHDWRKCEAKINAVPNFITEINGLEIHFIHVRSKHEKCRCLCDKAPPSCRRGRRMTPCLLLAQTGH